MVASLDGGISLVQETLKRADVDVDHVNTHGDSALSIATREGHSEIVRVLRMAGAVHSMSQLEKNLGEKKIESKKKH